MCQPTGESSLTKSSCSQSNTDELFSLNAANDFILAMDKFLRSPDIEHLDHNNFGILEFLRDSIQITANKTSQPLESSLLEFNSSTNFLFVAYKTLIDAIKCSGDFEYISVLGRRLRYIFVDIFVRNREFEKATARAGADEVQNI